MPPSHPAPHVMMPAQKLMCGGVLGTVTAQQYAASYAAATAVPHPVLQPAVSSTHVHPYMDPVHLQARRSGRHYVLNGVKRLQISQDPLMRSQSFFHQYQPDERASLDQRAKVR